MAAWVATVVLAAVSGARPAGAADEPPSVILIVTDDQRWDTLWAMPAVQEHLVGPGVTFTEAHVVNALCCPSRATILTGRHSHGTRVYRQVPPYGRFEWFDDSSTVATWLHAAGYRTGYFGKYIDGYQSGASRGYVPPGWDRWVAFAHAAYRDYGLAIDGGIRRFGPTDADYSTDVLAGMIERFVRGTDGPLFAVYAPAAPHDPATPAARHADAFDDLETWRPPSYWEEDLSDKPRWMGRIPEESAQTSAEIETLRRNQYRALLAVDEAVARIVDALADTGRLSNTLIVYTSDNGLAWGEHRWRKKEVPYEESIRVPMVVRFDPLVTDGRDDPSLVLNLDLAPSVAEAAGVEAPGAEGRSFLSLMASGDEPWRRDFLVEHMEGANPVPTYCAVRGERYVFARYATGEEELYDLALDPFQLTNRVEDPAMTQLRDTLRARLLELCDPPPPGLDLPFARPGPGPGVVGGALVGSLLALLGVGAVLSRRGAVARPR